MTTKTDTEQERAEFEAWANGRCELYLVNPAGRYSSAITQFAWEAYQAGRAALQSQDREDDPLQPAANWLIQAIESCTVADIQGRLSIGYNRAQRLFDHATQSRDRANAEWMTCESRRPWAANTLRERAKDLRSAEKRCRDAFKKDFMGEPARYVADAFGEAAAVFEIRLEAIDHARRIEGDGE